ncbi:type II toxin-antitoxin system RelE/ParE family toxin [Phenylobacterium sp. SCN 70-31]|uniref:type II toxin-antitoxin system RelE/ParE family toxin n=1 Tax=Phenylobacterium sp. SCN 70-31 TaxID=1660129 RepID=UPI00086CFBD5|nr:type II toxin-antitoxin system RelE/ParE family toxin [Phenylobacterium sp. SCN 70-31]ODT84532.1 MAG: hypothetical protein ABS78_22565 [Phenylobacterium sp. SCN 70-31]
MKRRRIVYAPEAEADLAALYDLIAARASPDIALRFVEQTQDWIEGFDVAAERGARRDDLRPGLRITGFRRRITLAFAVVSDEVRILRIFYAGQDWSALLQGGPPSG